MPNTCEALVSPAYFSNNFSLPFSRQSLEDFLDFEDLLLLAGGFADVMPMQCNTTKQTFFVNLRPPSVDVYSREISRRRSTFS